ncbi:MAG: hypothetical protein JJU28_13205 [Cyclobacteriaceae bacterium]|nr:hypothetical protein [Cyclobacteriaceae bacterium]
MRKLFILIFVVGVLALLARHAWYTYLPKKAAELMVREEAPAFFPEPLREKVKFVQQEVSEHTETMRKFIEKNDIPEEDVFAVIDRIRYKDLENFLQKAKARQYENADQLYDHIIGEFRLGNLPVESYRDEFRNTYQQEKLERAIAYFERNKNDIQIMFPTMKEMAKSLIKTRGFDKEAIRELTF